MIIETDDAQYVVELREATSHMIVAYDEHKNDNNIIDLGDGKKLDFSRGSLARTLVKSMITPIIVPMMTFLFKALGSELPKYIRGEDLFDYVIHNMLYLIGTHGDRLTLYVDTENVTNTRKNVKRVSTTKKQEILTLPTPEVEP